jgi:hypothetical protein
LSNSLSSFCDDYWEWFVRIAFKKNISDKGQRRERYGTSGTDNH